MEKLKPCPFIKEDECKIFVCKYYLPCGWCELKQTKCGKYAAIMYPRNYEPYMPNMVLVGPPNCGAKMDGGEDEQMD